MESYVVALNYAIPAFTILIAIEAAYGYFFADVKIRSLDTISSLSSGITNIMKDVLGLTVFLISYQFIESRVGIFDIKAGVGAFVLTFIYKDFAGYWKHRFEHSVNFFWNQHIVHHSSEEFNLPCALRQSISEIIDIGIFFVFPLAIIGVPIEVLALVAPIHLFAQFWYHTRFINRMGWLEYVLVTPSHHRVHHAINPEYIDKNYSQLFIFWDKIFGTFQEEYSNIPPVYGVKKAVKSWNPYLINFQHAWLILKDAWRTRSWKDKIRVWFMPTGWRPADVAEKYPIEIIKDVYKQEKYDTHPSNALTSWSWVLLLFNMGLMLYLFNHLAIIGQPDIFILGGFILFSILSYSSMMDKKRYALPLELVKSGVGFAFIYFQGDFFHINEWISFGSNLMIGYLGLSALMAVYFVLVEFKTEGKFEFAT